MRTRDRLSELRAGQFLKALAETTERPRQCQIAGRTARVGTVSAGPRREQTLIRVML